MNYVCVDILILKNMKGDDSFVLTSNVLGVCFLSFLNSSFPLANVSSSWVVQLSPTCT